MSSLSITVMEENLYSMYNVQHFIQTDIPLGRTTLESSLWPWKVSQWTATFPECPGPLLLTLLQRHACRPVSLSLLSLRQHQHLHPKPGGCSTTGGKAPRGYILPPCWLYPLDLAVGSHPRWPFLPTQAGLPTGGCITSLQPLPLRLRCPLRWNRWWGQKTGFQKRCQNDPSWFPCPCLLRHWLQPH